MQRCALNKNEGRKFTKREKLRTGMPDLRRRRRMHWIAIEEHGWVMAERVVAVAYAESAPVKRLLNYIAPTGVLILTGGRKRESVLLLDSGQVVVTALSVQRIGRLLREARYAE
jgi:regulator of extracellular matrix RemA (YlzA/DUF370 family)